MRLRAKVGWWLRCLADRIDREHAAVFMSGFSFTFEEGEGIRWRDDGRGCPLMHPNDQHDRAHTESDTERERAAAVAAAFRRFGVSVAEISKGQR